MSVPTIAVLGAGTRGRLFGRLIAERPGLGRVVAVAEPREAYREAFAREHGLPAAQVHPSWQAFTSGPRRCDAVVIATMDQDHLGPALACLAQGYDLLLEKPMAPDVASCEAIVRAQAASGAIVTVCHSLRYQAGFARLKALVAEGRLGKVRTIDQLEQVCYGHFAHSYVRGNWGNAGRATPFLLAKSCHDVDYLAWLAESPCTAVASFGSLGYFTPANAPPGAASRCLDGCAVEARCVYSARKVYLDTDRTAWPAATITAGHTYEEHLEAIRQGPFGRCVYFADNDVADHQVVAMEFASGTTATLTVTAFTHGGGRRIRVHGDEGEASFDEARIVLRRYGAAEPTVVVPPAEAGEHGGGDARLVAAWLKALKTRDPALVPSDAASSLRTHAIAFAAERSRLERRMVKPSEVF